MTSRKQIEEIQMLQEIKRHLLLKKENTRGQVTQLERDKSLIKRHLEDLEYKIFKRKELHIIKGEDSIEQLEQLAQQYRASIREINSKIMDLNNKTL